MNLTRKEVQLNIENEEFIMTFDNRSIATYQDLGKSFSQGYHKLITYDDEAIIDFIACTLRRKSEPNKPLGREVLEGDILFFLVTLAGVVISLIAESLPESKGVKKK
jgi:hypothetical protein